ncbi:MAG TPA: MFS transporter, partial [Nitrospiria bacterium]
MKADTGSSFWLLCVISLLAFVSYDLIRSPLVPLFAMRLGAQPEAIGLIVGLSTISGILFKLPAGTVSDYLGRRALLLAGLLVFAMAPFLYFTVGGVWQLMAVRSFHGLATAIFAPVALAVVADMARERRAEALSWYGSFSQTGRLSGRMLGGSFLVWWGFGTTFGVAAAAGIVAAALALRLRLPETRASGAGVRPLRASAASVWEGLKATAGDRGILATSAMEAVQMTASGALMAFLPLYGIGAGLHAGQVGLLFGVM